MVSEKYAVVLAAGKGTRMKSDLPKVLMEVAEKPMIHHVLENLFHIDLEKILIVVGYKKELVEEKTQEFVHQNYPEKSSKIEFVEQKEQLGTAHAFLMTEPYLSQKRGLVLVTAGDMPLIKTKSFLKLFELCEVHQTPGSVLGAVLENPTGYGRFVRNKEGLLEAIIEEKDADEETKKIKEINTGCYVFRLPGVFHVIKQINNHNVQKEYYLPDVIKVYRKQNQFFSVYTLQDSREAFGANTIDELNELNRIYYLLK
ncbi:MAG: NTP transferase domain-containing protein [Leptospiraceae bacterium]|nr:NTP transferase domain-containing protein [Leptospiraceae bacterium]MDW7975489.1 NTP transferase domain-containing protein [Leptospiraceae bacterium]